MSRIDSFTVPALLLLTVCCTLVHAHTRLNPMDLLWRLYSFHALFGQSPFLYYFLYYWSQQFRYLLLCCTTEKPNTRTNKYEENSLRSCTDSGRECFHVLFYIFEESL